MFDGFNTQPVWIQVVIGLIAFVVGRKLLSWFGNGLLEMFEQDRRDAARTAQTEEAARSQAHRDREFAEAKPTVFEEAYYIKNGGRMSIQILRTQISPEKLEALMDTVGGREFVDEVTRRREREGRTS